MTREKKELCRKIEDLVLYLDADGAGCDDLKQYLYYLEDELARLSHFANYRDMMDNEMYFQEKAKGMIS